jgi:heme-degrading monooxygenase HmoA
MPNIATNPNYVTYINSFRCPPGDQDEVVRINIDIVNQVAASSPGFVSASIHRSTDGTMVFNYLQWETAEHLEAMQSSPQFRQIASRFGGPIAFEPHCCEVVHTAEG